MSPAPLDRRICDLALEKGLITDEQLAEVRQAVLQNRDLSLVDLLLKSELITPEQLKSLRTEAGGEPLAQEEEPAGLKVEDADEGEERVEDELAGRDAIAPSVTILSHEGVKPGDAEEPSGIMAEDTEEGEDRIEDELSDRDAVAPSVTLLSHKGTAGEETPEPGPPGPPAPAAPPETRADRPQPDRPQTDRPTGVTVPAEETAVPEGRVDREKIGPYKILGEIGRGGMGIVYKAFDPSLKRAVALKVLIGGEDASETAIARFQREAEAAARLGHHPCIVPVYDMGTEGNLHYFAMAFVDGRPLTQLIGSGEVTPQRAMALAEQIARALHFAHQNGVLHRDVKPDNILVDATGQPNITDFGLAKDVQSGSKITVSGTAMGTPQYMPPEQADGAVEKMDARSDVYGVGATLYEMLSGHPPFEGGTYHNLLFKVLNSDVVPPRRHNPSVPRDAQTVVLKALEKEPGRRYQSAEEMADDIHRFLEGEAIQARPASIMYRVSKRVRRNPALYILGTLATAALLLSGIFFLVVKPRQERQEDIRVDTKAIEAALEKKLAPEKEAWRIFEEAKLRLARCNYDAAVALCDELVKTYTPLQGKTFKDIPSVRIPELLREPKYRALYTPNSMPIAQALALKARALQEKGDEPGSLNAWLLAYARAKPSADNREAAVSGPALLQIGRRLMAIYDLDRALRTFRKFLHTYPGHEQRDRAWLGLGETLWSRGRFAAAAEAFSRIRDPSSLTLEEQAALEWYLPAARFFSRRVSLPRPAGSVFTGDLDWDGREEIFGYDPKTGLSIYRLKGDALDRIFFIPKEQLSDFDAHPKMSLGAVGWFDLTGKKKGAVVFSGRSCPGNAVWVVPIDPRGTAGAPISGPLPGGGFHLGAGDLDGDGKIEFVRIKSGRPSQITVHRQTAKGIEEAAIEPQFNSYAVQLRVEDLDGDGKEEGLVYWSEWGPWQGWTLRWDGPGKPLEHRPLSPYRYYGNFIGSSPAEEKGRYVFIHNRIWSEAIQVARGITEERFILPRGLFRLVPGSDELPQDFTAEFPENRKPHMTSGAYAPDRDLLLTVGTDFARLGALGVRSLNLKRRWALHSYPKGTSIHRVFARQLDDDPETEVFAVLNKEILLFGSGEPPEVAEGELEGSDPAPAALGRVENAVLATAIEMAVMDWHEQALGLFRKAWEEADNIFEKRRARLGEADCLLRLDRTDDAVKVYRELASGSTAGITEELFALAELLKKKGEWKALLEVLGLALDKVPLPKELGTWAGELKRDVEPLTRLTHRVTVLPAEKYDPSYICLHAFKVPGRRGTGRDFEFFTDGARYAAFGRLLQYGGGPFRLETQVVFHRMDWGASFNIGMFRVSHRKDQAAPPSGLFLEAHPGRCTNIPITRLELKSWGLSRTFARTDQEYPPAYPTEYSFVIEYAPTLDRLSLRVRDLTHDREWEVWRDAPGKLPPGKYCLGCSGSWQATASMFQGHFAIRRFDFVSDTTRNKPAAWEPEPDAFALFRAGAALALGDFKTAETLAAKVDADAPDFQKDFHIPYFDRNAIDPPDAVGANLITALARLRSGDTKGFREALARALNPEPARVLWALSRSFLALSPSERPVVGAALRELLTANGGKKALEAVGYWKGKRHRPRDLSHIPAQAWDRLIGPVQKAAETGDPEKLLNALLEYIYSCCRPALGEWFFKGTSLESEARYRTLLDELQEFGGTGDSRSALDRCKKMQLEFPQRPRGLNAVAWSLLTMGIPELRDEKRALDIAKKAVKLARMMREEFPREFAYFLHTLAVAHARNKDYAAAVAAIEEGIKNLAKDEREQVRQSFQQNLINYKRRLAEEKEKGK
jgi:tetratricopeptide (TPR) repeat protein